MDPWDQPVLLSRSFPVAEAFTALDLQPIVGGQPRLDFAMTPSERQRFTDSLEDPGKVMVRTLPVTQFSVLRSTFCNLFCCHTHRASSLVLSFPLELSAWSVTWQDMIHAMRGRLTPEKLQGPSSKFVVKHQWATPGGFSALAAKLLDRLQSWLLDQSCREVLLCMQQPYMRAFGHRVPFDCFFGTSVNACARS